jgi:hypothetical protein
VEHSVCNRGRKTEQPNLYPFHQPTPMIKKAYFAGCGDCTESWRIKAGRARQGQEKRAAAAALLTLTPTLYKVDSISKPQASSRGSGMYFEFLFRRAHSRSRVERRY